jgi:hypothetical protein
MNTKSTQDRNAFLTTVFDTAIRNHGYGEFHTSDYTAGADATIQFTDDTATRYVTLDTMTRGIATIRDADETAPVDGEVLFNAQTGEPLYMSCATRNRILDAVRDNGTVSGLGVLDALAILYCGVLGAVAYC